MTKEKSDLGCETIEVATYRCFNNSSNNSDLLIVIWPATLNCTRRNGTKFIQPMTSIDLYKFNFFPYSITQWNKLPDHVVNTTSLDNFKSLLKLHL